MKQLTKRIYPALGHKRLDKITSRDVQKFITDLLVNGKNMNNGKPLSRKTAVHHLSLISDVFSYAIRMGMLTDNPCRRVVVPKAEQEEKQIYTLDEVKTLYEHLKDEPMKYQVYLLLSIYSGYRRSEMLGLEWKDISVYKGKGHIHRYHQDAKVQACVKIPTVYYESAKAVQDRAGQGSETARYKMGGSRQAVHEMERRAYESADSL